MYMLMSTRYPCGNFLELLYRGDAEIRRDIHKLSEAVFWDHIFSKMLPGVSISACTALVLWHSAQLYCDYIFRFGMLQAWPYKVFWLVKDDVEVSSPLRREIAQNILDADDSALGITISKIKKAFRCELEECTTSGRIPKTMWQMLRDCGSKLRAHTQDVEGANNMLLEICKRSGHISQQSASDRLKTRRSVIHGSEISRWSNMKTKLDRTRQLVLSHLPFLEKVMGEVDRYATPEPFPIAVNWNTPAVSAEKAWRSKWNRRWMSIVKPDGFQHCVTITSPAGTTAYFLTKTHRSLGFLVSGKITIMSMEHEFCEVRLDLPFEMFYTYDVIGSFYDAVENTNAVVEAYVWDSSNWSETYWSVVTLKGPKLLFRMDKLGGHFFCDPPDPPADGGDGGGGGKRGGRGGGRGRRGGGGAGGAGDGRGGGGGGDGAGGGRGAKGGRGGGRGGCGRKGRRGRGRAGMGGGKGEEEEPDVKVAKVEAEDEQGDVSDVPMAEEVEEEKLAEAEAETEDAEDLKYAQELELGVEERGESEEPGIGKECSDDEHAAHQSLKRIKKIKKRVGAANCDKLKQTELLCLEQHPCDREDRQ